MVAVEDRTVGEEIEDAVEAGSEAVALELKWTEIRLRVLGL